MADHRAPDSPPLVPYLAVHDGRAALAFYEEALGATVEGDPIVMPDGGIGHANLRVGDAVFMLSDAFPEMGVPSPRDLGGSPVALMLYVADCDAATERAVAAGMELEMPPTDQFWGNRDSRVRDPFGHRWNLATTIEDVSPEEMARRVAEFDPSSHDGD